MMQALSCAALSSDWQGTSWDANRIGPGLGAKNDWPRSRCRSRSWSPSADCLPGAHTFGSSIAECAQDPTDEWKSNDSPCSKAPASLNQVVDADNRNAGEYGHPGSLLAETVEVLLPSFSGNTQFWLLEPH